MIENLNDVINTLDNIAQDYKTHTHEWNQLVDCIGFLCNLKSAMDNLGVYITQKNDMDGKLL
ncbi:MULTISPECIES: hypothetical protein [Bacillota]|jgi:REP element-mobilizing transposase RayT|uniref:Uncharacterized protein n=1 Tax=[Eubacterium] hominis TaxID=2764325 RepID=A0A7G9GPQ4_9FIRM|nr:MULTISPECIES: hypothetical protein [Bacillota]QNM12786.1 hypothetical protein H9Q80_02205 [[Eubacterium] hominis]DAY68655.1 MAG TPA: hypothetical protein [Caudoviricetes sp.]RGB58254.1 hypothetical protein DW271_00745 [Absiella sp. AM22-9]RGB60026.1 hypothetical protein DW120_10365 [Absiella sp. AM10-20]RGB63577.1 hypothetical protein DW113_18025 [Absiella sp. AM09-45]